MSYEVLEIGSSFMKIQLTGTNGSFYDVKVNNVTQSDLSYNAIITFTGLISDCNYTVYVYKKAQTFNRVFVRSRATGTPLSLAEVQVWDHNDNLISRDSTLIESVTQTSTLAGGVASRAVDGNTDGRWGQGSVTHTKVIPGRYTYWILKFNSNVSIKRIKIYNRTDCCSGRLNGAKLMLYRDTGKLIYTETLVNSISQEFTFPA